MIWLQSYWHELVYTINNHAVEKFVVKIAIDISFDDDSCANWNVYVIKYMHWIFAINNPFENGCNNVFMQL